MRIERSLFVLLALTLVIVLIPQAALAGDECEGAEAIDWTPDQVIDALTAEGLDVEPVSAGGSHPACPIPRACGDICLPGTCGPLVFPPQCSQQDLGDNRCTLGGRSIKVCPKGQTIHTSTCACRDVAPCVCGNRVAVSCQ